MTAATATSVRPARGPAAGRPPNAPDADRFVAAVARTFLEVEAGHRPLAQLTPLLAPALQSRLAARPRRSRAGPGDGAVLGVRTCVIGRDVVDGAAVVRRGERASVLAIRIERHRGAWRVVEIARPEDGRAATVTRSRPWAPPEPDAFDEAAAEAEQLETSAER